MPTRVIELSPHDLGEAGTLAANILKWGPSRSVSSSYWDWRIRHNPALTNGQPLGWGIRNATGRLVGLLLNVPQLIWCDGQLLTAYASSTYIVAPDFRQRGLLLAHTFAQQKEVRLLLNTTANPTVRKIFLHFGFSELSGWDEVFFWILDPFQLAASLVLLKKRGLVLAGVLNWISTLPGVSHLAVKIGWPKPTNVVVEKVHQIDTQFDQLWEEVKSEYEITAARTARVLSWRFHGNPLQDRRLTVLAAKDRQGKLLGYLAWRRFDTPELALKRARIVDLFASKRHPEVVDALLLAVLSEAKADGVSVLEIAHVGNEVRQHLTELGVFRRRTSSGAYLFKWNGLNPPMRVDGWHMSGIDGDFSM